MKGNTKLAGSVVVGMEEYVVLLGLAVFLKVMTESVQKHRKLLNALSVDRNECQGDGK